MDGLLDRDHENDYKIYYIRVSLFSAIEMLFQSVGIQLNNNIKDVVSEFLQDEKLTYMKLYSDYENYMTSNVTTQIDRGLKYAEEFKITELHPYLISYKFLKECSKFIEATFFVNPTIFQDLTNLIDELIVYKEKFHDITRHLQTILEYSISIFILTGSEQHLLNYGPIYLKNSLETNQFSPKFNENFSVIGDLIIQYQQFTAIENIFKDLLNLSESPDQNDEFKMILYRFATFYFIYKRENMLSMITYANKYLEFAEKIKGKLSNEYIEASELLARCYLVQNNIAKAYQLQLESYETAEQLYGSIENPNSSQILFSMALCKIILKQFSEAK